MDAKTCLKKMQLVGVLNLATVDENGAPQIRCVSAVHYEEDSFYFFTAKGKNMTRELLADGRVQLSGISDAERCEEHRFLLYFHRCVWFSAG